MFTLISQPSPTTLRITPKDIKSVLYCFKVEGNADECQDVLYVFDGTNDQTKMLAELCGYELPPILRSKSSNLLLIFVTDGENIWKGFKAEYVFGVWNEGT